MAEKRTLLVITPTIRRGDQFLHRRYLDTFILPKIYKIKYVTKLEHIRGYDDNARFVYMPGFYVLKEIDAIRDRIKLIKFTEIKWK
jgi:hypothetical protein